MHAWDKLAAIGTAQPALSAAVIAGIFATLGSLTNIWTKSRQSKSPFSKRISQIQHASGRVRFWASWHRSIRSMGSGRERVQWSAAAKEQLELAAREMTHAMDQHDAKLKLYLEQEAKARLRAGEIVALPTYRKILLLYLPANGRVAFIHRLVFYLVLTTLLTAIYGSIGAYRADSAVASRYREANLRTNSAEDKQRNNYMAELYAANNRELCVGFATGFVILLGLAAGTAYNTIDEETKRREYRD